MKIIDTDGEVLTSDIFDGWTKKFERGHPILHKIDLLFKEKTLVGYRASYTVTHPWLIVEYVFKQTKYAFQRAFRGWDDTVIWSIDYHIAKMLPLWMRQLEKDKIGTPSMLFHEGDEIVHEDGSVFPSDETMDARRKEWDEILEKVAVGFESYLAREEYKFETEEEETELVRKFEEGFDLLRKYWGCFWD